MVAESRINYVLLRPIPAPRLCTPAESRAVRREEKSVKVKLTATAEIEILDEMLFIYLFKNLNYSSTATRANNETYHDRQPKENTALPDGD